MRAARLFDELQVAHGDGSFARRLTQLAKLDLLVIDDFAISPIGPAERSDLLGTYSGGTRTPWAGSIVPAVRALDRCRRRVGDDVEVIYAREQITLGLSTAFGYRDVP